MVPGVKRKIVTPHGDSYLSRNRKNPVRLHVSKQNCTLISLRKEIKSQRKFSEGGKYQSGPKAEGGERSIEFENDGFVAGGMREASRRLCRLGYIGKKKAH